MSQPWALFAGVLPLLGPCVGSQSYFLPLLICLGATACVISFISGKAFVFHSPGTVRACDVGAVQARGQRPGKPGAGGLGPESVRSTGQSGGRPGPEQQQARVSAAPARIPPSQREEAGAPALPLRLGMWCPRPRAHSCWVTFHHIFGAFFFFLFNKGHILLRQE